MMKTYRIFLTVVVFSCLYASVNASSCESIMKGITCKKRNCTWKPPKKKGKRVVRKGFCIQKMKKLDTNIPEKCGDATTSSQCNAVETETCTWVKKHKTCILKTCSSYKRKKNDCVNNERCQWLTRGRKKFHKCGDKELTDSPTTATGSSTTCVEIGSMTPDMNDPNCKVLLPVLEGKYYPEDCEKECNSKEECGFAHILKTTSKKNTCFLMKKPQDGDSCTLKHAPSRKMYNCRNSNFFIPQGTAQPTPPPTPIVPCIEEKQVVPVPDENKCTIINTFPDTEEIGCVDRCTTNRQCRFASWNANWDITRTTNECTLWKGDECSFMENKKYRTYRCKGAKFVNTKSPTVSPTMATMEPITCTRVNNTMPTNTSSQDCTEMKRHHISIGENGKEICALECQKLPNCLFAHVNTRMTLGKRVCVLMKGVCASKEADRRTTYLCNGGTLEPPNPSITPP